jgi:hypothetical protein
MALNDIKFQKVNGGIGRVAANEDVVSGLIISTQGKLTETLISTDHNFDVTGATGNLLYVAKISYYEQLANQYGIKTNLVAPDGETSDEAGNRTAMNAIDYHVREFFRQSPTGMLYLAVRLTGEVSGQDIKVLQYYASGKLRQAGVLTAGKTNFAAYQTAATDLEQEHQPISVIATYAGYGTFATQAETLTALGGSTNHVIAGRSNLSILVGCDLDPVLVMALGNFAYFGIIGNALGCVSRASVNESIGWVQKFPLGLLDPGFITGDLLCDVTEANLNLINDNRYIFVRTHVGTAGNYFNDSFTMDVATSDYAFIENTRTMDKTTRGIRTNLLPYLGSPVYVDAETGKLRPDNVAFLETIASIALENMEKTGELSGYRAEINPEQNILATSELEVVIKNVPVGVLRKVLVKIGYTTALN